MAKRPRYKQLYEEKERDYQREYDRRARLQQRLSHIHKVLAPVGLRIARCIPDGTTPVVFDAHDYLCISEYFEDGKRWSSDEEVDAGYQHLAWRGRPIHHE